MEVTQLSALEIWAGGQTGADRGAHDAGAELNLPRSGWCPKGRVAEDGVIPAHYPVRECTSADYPVRTKLNVADTDATLILHQGKMGRGSRLTKRLAGDASKPCLVVDLRTPPSSTDLLRWLVQHGVKKLNVAGPRESSSAGIGERVKAWLVATLGEIVEH